VGKPGALVEERRDTASRNSPQVQGYRFLRRHDAGNAWRIGDLDSKILSVGEEGGRAGPITAQNRPLQHAFDVHPTKDPPEARKQTDLCQKDPMLSAGRQVAVGSRGTLGGSVGPRMQAVSI